MSKTLIASAIQRPAAAASFVILDDGSDMAHLSDRLVRTDYAMGPQEADSTARSGYSAAWSSRRLDGMPFD